MSKVYASMIFFVILSLFAVAQVFIPFSFWQGRALAVTNQCPASPGATLSITINYSASDATSCSFTAVNAAAMSGTGACSCTAGVCTMTGLTYLNSFLATMTPGANYILQTAFTYSIVRPSGTFSSAQSVSITKGTWDPNCLGSSLLMWMDATAASTVYQDLAGTTPAVSGSTVALWKDRSQYLVNATQGTVANRPTFATGLSTYINFSNNWSTVFNYMSSALTQSGASGFNGAVGSMFGVVNSTSTGGNNFISIMGFRPAGGDFTGFSLPNSTTWGLDWYTNSVYNWNTGATITNGANTIVGFTNATGAQLFSRNGTTYSNTLATSSIPSRATALVIANDPCCGNTRYFNGYIFELLAIKLNLTTALRTQIEGYLAWKYNLAANLPAGHTYKSFAP